eukprot:GHVL01031029.1.p1 GENE.GHVL01031029.1~~GHVL01031029.1.p1  ORF type:complete len:266 (-),score=38.53 GHVL01031029.1:336-1133(-)
MDLKQTSDPSPKRKYALEKTIIDESGAKEVVCSLCRLMYEKNWAVGSSGGVTVKTNGNIYIAPSGVQKELLKPEDIFVLDSGGEILHKPQLKISECAPIFLLIYQLKKAGCVYHFHSIHSLLVSVMDEANSRVFKVRGMEMLKGVRPGMQWDDLLSIPIIENTPTEAELTPYFRKCLVDNPETNVVLVRRHGVYVWGENWEKTKIHAECLEYIFRASLEMKRLGVDLESGPVNKQPIEKSDNLTVLERSAQTDANAQRQKKSKIN